VKGTDHPDSDVTNANAPAARSNLKAWAVSLAAVAYARAQYPAARKEKAKTRVKKIVAKKTFVRRLPIR